MKDIIPVELIEHNIYMLRGHKVMIDRDLAKLYDIETRVLNQAVRRHRERFPDDFVFVLTRDEIRDLSQIVISPGLKNAPNVFAFTEYGVSMLSSVLNSQRAIEINIQIMRTFGRLREMISTHKDLAKKLEDLEQKYDSQFKMVFDAIRQLITTPEPKKKKAIGFGRE